MLGNMLVNLIIQNSRFYYIFDMTRDYGFNIKNIRKIHLLGFSIQRLWGKSFKISKRFCISSIFSKPIEKAVCHLGLDPPIYLILNKYLFTGAHEFFSLRQFQSLEVGQKTYRSTCPTQGCQIGM